MSLPLKHTTSSRTFKNDKHYLFNFTNCTDTTPDYYDKMIENTLIIMTKSITQKKKLKNFQISNKRDDKIENI